MDVDRRGSIGLASFDLRASTRVGSCEKHGARLGLIGSHLKLDLVDIVDRIDLRDTVRVFNAKIGVHDDISKSLKRSLAT